MKFRWYIWIPRVLIIAVSLFMALFSADVFEMKASFWQKMLGLFIHNIPTLILLLILVFTWKHPLWSGWIFLMAGVVFIVLIYLYKRQFIAVDYLFIAFPILVCSDLYFLVHYNRPIQKTV